MLKIDLRVGESVAIGSHALITLEDKSGKIARLAIEAERSVPITRIKAQTVANMAANVGITGLAGRKS